VGAKLLRLPVRWHRLNWPVVLTVLIYRPTVRTSNSHRATRRRARPLKIPLQPFAAAAAAAATARDYDDDAFSGQ